MVFMGLKTLACHFGLEVNLTFEIFLKNSEHVA